MAPTRACLLLAATLALGARATFIDNTKPRLDSTGAILDGHDCTIQKFTIDGVTRYWMHTVAYGDCLEPNGMGCNTTTKDHCGFRQDHNISIYTSTDLSSGSWEFVGLAINWTDRPAGTVFRPDLSFVKSTSTYVLWWNWVAANGSYMGYAAATSSTPAGPFKLQVDVVPGLVANNHSWHGGDYHRFVDDDGTPYVIYSSNHYMFIDQLADDQLSGIGKGVGLGPYFVEAPMLFKRKGTYYALFGHCCCYCYQGSGIMVFTAPHPLGPWTEQAGGDIACVDPPSAARLLSGPRSPLAAGGEEDGRVDAAVAMCALHEADGREGYTDLARTLGVEITPATTPGQGCLYNSSKQVSTTRSQQSFIATVDTRSGEQALIWIGDRWQQAPDGIKGHEPQFWAPLVFDAAGVIAKVEWLENFTLDIV